MNRFIDSSVALAACLSRTGGSRLIFDLARAHGWALVVSPWVLREVRENLVTKPPEATHAWLNLRKRTIVEDDELAFDWPLVFPITKDKPVLCTALASADILLSLDRNDFRSLLDKTVYGLQILTPGKFLQSQREAGRISPEMTSGC